MSGRHQIPVLQKAIRVLGALAEGRGDRTAAKLSRDLKIAPATGYRIIQTLAQAGWVHVGEDGQCELGLGLLPVLQRLQEHDLLGARISEFLHELTAKTGMASKVSVRESCEAVTVMRVNSSQPMALAVRPGSRFHLVLGSSGAVLLSAMEDDEIRAIVDDAPANCWDFQKPADVLRRVREARDNGIVVDAGTYRPDILGISVPLLDSRGRICGAVTITGLRHGHSPAQIRQWGDMLAKKAAGLGRQPNSQGDHKP